MLLCLVLCYQSKALSIDRHERDQLETLSFLRQKDHLVSKGVHNRIDDVFPSAQQLTLHPVRFREGLRHMETVPTGLCILADHHVFH
jgi:hypothetical protein